MVKWHEAEAELSRQRRASAVERVQGNGGGGGNRRSGRKNEQGNASREGNSRKEWRGNCGRRKREGDGGQGRKAPGRLGSRTWPYYIYGGPY